MEEITFLAAEVDNDSENLEDETDPNSSGQVSADDHKVAEATDKLEQLEHKEPDKNNGQETVEICQRTVNPHIRVNSENFKIQRVIGKGGYGKVFLVQKTDGVDQGKLYAMKVLKKARLICNEKDKAHTVSERNILEMLRHPFLVKLHYAFQNHSNLYIVLEYCPGGELFNYLEREGALLENSACFYTAEIILAIGHLHSLGIIYRDLKSENVLLDRQGHVKLTDFGLSKEGVCTTNTFCGTIEYMAPEIIRCEGHGKAVDWWSLGTLLFDMLSGGPPFTQEESREATTRKILTAPIRFPPSFSPEVTSLIRGLLKRDPRERLGSKGDVEEIKKHRFFRRHDINWSDVLHRRLRPPFRPKLVADNDVSMFDPTFTRLQPVVSPDNGRSIPPDMFQGFSYVAPSVCEDAMREPWVDSQLGAQRRHYGTRGTQSAGRLRRLGANPTQGSGGVSNALELRLVPQTSNPNPPGTFSNVPNKSVITSKSTVSAVRNIRPDHCRANPPLTATTVGVGAQNVASTMSVAESTTISSCADPTSIDSELMEGLSLQEEDEDAAVADEEDEELEEENIPGAQAIQTTIAHCAMESCPRAISSIKSATSPDMASALAYSRPKVQVKSAYTTNPAHAYRHSGARGIAPSSSHRNVRQLVPSVPTTSSRFTSGPPAPSTTSSNTKCAIM